MNSDGPVLMNTSWLVPAGNERSPTDQSKLANQYRAPMLVEEIRFASLEGISAAGAVDDGWRTAGFRMFQSQIKMVIGQRHLTRDFIRGDLLAPRPAGDGEIVIRLREPIYLGANDIIHPTVRAPATQDVTVQFTLIGRLVGARPRGSPFALPYWTSYTTPSVAAGGTGSFKSTRSQLNNSFRVPLRVRQFVGVGESPNSTFPEFEDIRLRMSDHEGSAIIRDPIYLRDLFQPRDRAWSVSTVLPPNGFYVFNTDIQNSTLTPTSFRVSMFGYREETVL